MQCGTCGVLRIYLRFLSGAEEGGVEVQLVHIGRVIDDGDDFRHLVLRRRVHGVAAVVRRVNLTLDSSLAHFSFRNDYYVCAINLVTNHFR